VPAANAVEGRYFDGATSRAYPVTLTVESGIACLHGDISLQCPLDQLRVSQRVRNGVRRITFPGNTMLETRDLVALEAVLAASGFREGWVSRAQHSWRAILLTLSLTIMVLAAAYRFGLPAAAKLIAFALPISVEKSIGNDALAFLDKHWFAPTTLAAKQRDAIVHRFMLMSANNIDVPAYRILFRASKIGPNAFTLPSGDIVLTDELVRLAGNDDAIMGVLGHEFGHVRQRHITRRLIQEAATAALATMLLGDVSVVAANVPTVLLDMAYSREAEQEADDEAIALLRANNIAPEAFAQLIEALAKTGAGIEGYLSSHPAPIERVARIRASRSAPKKDTRTP
jgi:predicted Zn-dependent protease